MEKLFRFFAERNLLAYIITLLVILLGAGTLFSIKRDSFPSVEFGELFITTQYPGASPEDVELNVTNNIEKEIKEVTGIKRYQSWSLENVSMIHVVIDPNEKDDNKVIREIREAVSRVTDLPIEVTESPLITELGTSVFPMIEVGLTGEIPYAQLREVARLFEKKLENVTGVSKVERFGYRAREIQVQVSPQKLQKTDVSLVEVIRAIQGRNVRATGGTLESYVSEKNIVTLAQFRDPQEVGDVIVQGTFSGPLVKVKDLAIINDDFEEQKLASRVNGKSAISFVAYKMESADIIRTVDAIHAMIEKEKPYLPAEVSVLVSNDASTYVRNRFDIVITNGLLGLVLVLLVLTLFLDLRIAVWVAVGVPVSILGVIFLLPAFDSFLDSVTMTAMVLVIGIIVDDAIIISEHIYERFQQGASAVEAAVQGVTEVFKPVLTTMLTTLVAFAPLFFMPGMLGKFVYVIPLVVTLALLVSLIESTLALPAHLTGGLKLSYVSKKESPKNYYMAKLRDRYRGAIKKLLRFRYIVVLVFLLLLGGSLVFAFKFLDFILFPSSTADRFVILVETPIGTSLKATSDKTRLIEQLVGELPKEELDSFVTRIGTFGDIGSSERENNAAVYVSLTPFANRARSADQIVEELRAKTTQLTGFLQINYQIDAGGPPVGRPIEIQIVGTDDQMRTKLADDIMAYLESFAGAKDLERDDKVGKDQIEVVLNYDKLARVGISVADVAQNLRIAYDGEVVTSVRYGDEDVDFRVIFNQKTRQNPQFIKQLMLPNPSGHLTLLSQLGTTVIGPGPANIHHYKGDRTITLKGDIDKTQTTPLKVSQAVVAKFDVNKDYPGMQLVIGGEAQESEQSLQELFMIMGIAGVAIYFLLILLFNSLWQPFLVMMAIPFGMIGVIVGFAIHGEALSFLAMTGIIGLAGVVVNDSLVLVNHINELRDADPERNISAIVAEGSANRLRAVLLTTISTVAGLLPLAYGIGGADPYMSPMALALGWGLLFATPLTLVLLPSMYLIGSDIKQKFAHTKSPS